MTAFGQICCTWKALTILSVITGLITAGIFLYVLFEKNLSIVLGPETFISKTLSAHYSDSMVQSLRPVSLMTSATDDAPRMTQNKIKVRLQERERVRFIVPGRNKVEKKALQRHLVVENLFRPDMGKSQDVNLARWHYHFRDDRHQVSGNKGTPSFVVRENPLRRIPLYSGQRNNYEVDVRADSSVSKVTNQNNQRPNYGQMRYNDHSTNHTPPVQKNVLSRYNEYKSNNSIGKTKNKRAKKNYNSLDESIWTKVINSELTVNETSVLKSPDSRDNMNNNNLNQLAHGSVVHNLNSQDSGNNFDYTPMKQVLNNTILILSPSATRQVMQLGTPQLVTRPQSQTAIYSEQPGFSYVQNPISSLPQYYNTSAPMKFGINWRKIGIVLALIKLGLVKLVAYGFLRILFAILFKLKILLIALFLKLTFLSKLLIFFKLQILPLPLLLSLPILASVIYPTAIVGLPSVPSRIMNMILGRFDTSATPIDPSKASDYSSNPKTTIIHENLMPQRETDEVLPTNDILEQTIDLTGGRNFNTLKSLNPVLNFFQKALDFEMCLERIACLQSTLARRDGNTSPWIVWTTHQISKLIPNDKFVLYLKTYNKISDQIKNIPVTQNKWTWCLEHYTCNNKY